MWSPEFPDAARQLISYPLWRVQRGDEPADWKPKTSVGLGVSEIRVHVDGAHRVFYVAKFPDAV